MCGCHNVGRPNFGNEQIRSIEEIHVGGRLTLIHSHLDPDQSQFVKVLEIGDRSMKCRQYYHSGGSHDDDLSFTDCGVLAYGGGRWNRTNYLVRGWPWRFRVMAILHGAD